MHEMSLAGAVVNTVRRHADGRKVLLVSMRIGRLRQVVLDTLEFYFEIVARDTVCEGAKLEIEDVPARLHCAKCDQEWEIELPAYICPTCGPGAVEVVSGEEFEVESIEIEEKDPCTAPK
ncbi:MAG: hydrogenase maturation nickel metallochaperone HypA [Actinomycetota bacterium]|nr:hydrogenase maturation nickel metallochaperone HypA [Actinomycetota bacterium]